MMEFVWKFAVLLAFIAIIVIIGEKMAIGATWIYRVKISDYSKLQAKESAKDFGREDEIQPFYSTNIIDNGNTTYFRISVTNAHDPKFDSAYGWELYQMLTLNEHGFITPVVDNRFLYPVEKIDVPNKFVVEVSSK